MGAEQQLRPIRWLIPASAAALGFHVLSGQASDASQTATALQTADLFAAAQAAAAATRAKSEILAKI